MPICWSSTPSFLLTPLPLFLLSLPVLPPCPLCLVRSHLSFKHLDQLSSSAGSIPKTLLLWVKCLLSVLFPYYPMSTPNLTFGGTRHHLCACHPQHVQQLPEAAVIVQPAPAACLAQSQHWVHSCRIEFQFLLSHSLENACRCVRWTLHDLFSSLQA